jgi:predicted secreted protein
MKIRVAAVSFFILVAGAFCAFAGDVATFINLGFSDDSGYFMFGFHGTNGDTNKPFAEIYTVDVKANSFVSGGVAKESFAENLQPGQDASGAFYTLLEKNAPLVNRFKIRHLRQGRLLYILLNGDTIKEELEFRDFNTRNQYRVRLIQTSSGSGAQVKAAFHISFTIAQAAGTKNFVIGRPDFYREKVMDYRIRQIILSPDEKHLVFVIERDQHTPQGKAVRYMVETVKIF